ncbi:MAG: hypothetical protein JO285_12505, partial [Kutzneria sp.]|nr:hypothetical protein [Kutzneria sp.]
MTWFEVAPVALVSVGWLVVPGLVIGYLAGLRGIAAWGSAPMVSVAVVATTAVVAGAAKVAWSVPLVLAVAAAVAAVVGLAALVLRKRFAAVRPADGKRVTIAAAIGVLPAIALNVLVVVRGMGSPDAIAQTYDSIFHYNAVRQVLDTHNASSLTLGGLNSPGIPAAFYPAGFHDVTSLVLLTTGVSIPVAVNLTAGVIGAVLWPLTMLLFVRQIAGPSRMAMLIAGLVSTCFIAFPWVFLGFGILWPNLLGMSLVPAGAAAVMSVAGVANDDVLGKARGWMLLCVALVSGGLAHPNTVFSLAVIAFFAVLTGLSRWAARQRADGNGRRGTLVVAGYLLAVLAVWYWAATTPVFADVRNFYWPPMEGAARAIGEILLNAPAGRPTLWAISAAVLVGGWLAIRRRELRWLVAAHVTSAFLYLLTATVNSPSTRGFTGYWYNDPQRLAAMLPITGVPLAVLGIVHLARCLHDRLAPGDATPPRWNWWRGPVPSAAALTLVLLLALGVGSFGFYAAKRITTVSVVYGIASHNPEQTMLTPAERDFFLRVKGKISPDEVVADNPWDGSAMLYTIADRKVLYAHVDLPQSMDRDYLAKHLDEGSRDPQVCQLATRMNVRYLLIGNNRFWYWDDRRKNYPGFADPQGKPGFE